MQISKIKHLRKHKKVYSILIKGLRNLSVKVRDIVLELKSTSYKDVA